MQEQQRWQQLQSLSLNAQDAKFNFEQRLVRENDWPAAYARRAIEEYRRFVFLVSISSQQLTPSDEVDQVWHLHLLYTESYWQEMCECILGFALHHKPTKGGSSEQQRFAEQYRNTLTLYEATFGHPPPGDIWPDAESRFTHADQFIRINRKKVWLWNKPDPRRLRLSLSILLPTLLVACGHEGDDSLFVTLLKIIVGGFTIYYVIKFIQWLDDGRGGGGSGCGGCSGCSGCGD